MTALSRSSNQNLLPENLVWDAATSAYQIEGSPLAYRAGPSTWHRFTHTPGRVPTGETGDVACDHDRRWRNDIALMRELGLDAYPLSISWIHVLPGRPSRVQGAV